MTPRRVWMSAGVAVVLAALTPDCLHSQDGGLGAFSNRVTNPGFEDRAADPRLPAGWSADASVYDRDEGVVRSGRASLRFENTDPGLYRLASQRVPLEPGRKYRFAGYVKTQGIAGQGSGAAIALEWQDEEGAWLGGCYPPGVWGTDDWTLVESITRIPEDAGSVGILCYVRRGMTGRAWFDDVEIVEVEEPAMQTVLVSPVYRGWVTETGPDWIRVRARFNPGLAETSGDSVSVRAQLQFADGVRYIVMDPRKWPVAEPCDLEIPAMHSPPGGYSAVVQLSDAAGRELQTDRHPILRLEDDFRARVTIDEHRRLIVDGEPVFPLGMYWDRIGEEDLRRYAEGPFNCLMPAVSPDAEEMYLIHRLGLWVIYSMKDFYAGSRWAPGFVKTEADEETAVRSCVRRFRDHPALLAWYLNDELPETYLPRLESHYRWAKEEDPDHPAWAVLCQVEEVGRYIHTFDVIGTDPYPIDRESPSLAARWTAETLRQVEGARPLWQVVQAFNRGNYIEVDHDDPSARTPSFEEMYSMAWQCICEGATGLFFYSFQDIQRNPDVPFPLQWRFLKMIATGIDRMSPVLLSVDSVPEVRVDSESGDPSWLHWTTRVHDGRLYVIAVNDGDGEGRVTFSLPGKRLTRVLDLTSACPTPPPRGDSFDAQMSRLEARIFEIWWEAQ